MTEISKFHVGLDVHKDSISVAVAGPGRTAGRLVGKVIHDVSKLIKLLGKIGPADQLHLVYEAGPTGFGLQRTLNAKGYCCEIIAPSQIPRRAGDRIKTDGRDSIELAECSRAGQLSAIWIPDPEDEAIRDLSRRGIRPRGAADLGLGQHLYIKRLGFASDFGDAFACVLDFL